MDITKELFFLLGETRSVCLENNTGHSGRYLLHFLNLLYRKNRTITVIKVTDSQITISAILHITFIYKGRNSRLAAQRNIERLGYSGIFVTHFYAHSF